MDKDIQTCLTDIASELKGMRHILSAMWHSRYSQGETDVMNPEAYADEYISIEECAKRCLRFAAWEEESEQEQNLGAAVLQV